MTLANALARIANLKRNRPEAVHYRNREHELLAIQERRRHPTEADRLAERLRGLGYDVRYGWDAALGVYAEAWSDGQQVALASRCSSVLECLRQVAGELGEEIEQ